MCMKTSLVRSDIDDVEDTGTAFPVGMLPTSPTFCDASYLFGVAFEECNTLPARSYMAHRDYECRITPILRARTSEDSD